MGRDLYILLHTDSAAWNAGEPSHGIYLCDRETRGNRVNVVETIKVFSSHRFARKVAENYSRRSGYPLEGVA